MSIAEVIAVQSLAVGSPGTDRACTRFARSVRVEGPEGSDGVSMRHEQWQATCHIAAANTAAVAATWEAVKTEFCTRGQRVTAKTFAGTRVLPESGTPSGSEERSIAGYPTVQISELADESYGTWLSFEVRAETMVPIVGEGDLVEHDYLITESESAEGRITTSQRGSVRMKNGTSARTWLDDNVIDDARAAAAAAGLAFTARFTQGLDASQIDYEFNQTERSDGGAGTYEAEVNDVSVQSEAGRIVRTVSGYALGPSATTFAEAQEPEPSATLIQVRRSVSQPAVPSGRVNFTFEFWTGVEDARFPGITIYRYQERVAKLGGGQSLASQRWHGAAPSMRLGERAEYLYGQDTTIEYAGGWNDHGITCVFDTNLLAREPLLSKVGGAAGLRQVAMSFLVASATEIDPLPDPLEISAFV